MRQLVVLSGKGGTGKTTVSAAIIRLASLEAFADCDVDAPNLHLVMAALPQPEEALYYGYDKAVLYEDLCTGCGLCEAHCRFDAIRGLKVDPYACEGCGVCEWICPVRGAEGQKAIRLEKASTGKTQLFLKPHQVFSTAELKMGSGASGKLVTQVRKNLHQHWKGPGLALIDGSPGIGCPVIASVTGAAWVLVVAEPTLSGIHDMKRIVDTARRFGAQVMVCVNKADVSPAHTEQIRVYCQTRQLELVGLIPYDPQAVQAVNKGKTLADYPESPGGAAIRKVWARVSEIMTDQGVRLENNKEAQS